MCLSIRMKYTKDNIEQIFSWKDVFVDFESGISHYSWAVGTHAGYDNVFSFADTDEECAKTPEQMPLSLKEGHAYFVTVKVTFILHYKLKKNMTKAI